MGHEQTTTAAPVFLLHLSFLVSLLSCRRPRLTVPVLLLLVAVRRLSAQKFCSSGWQFCRHKSRRDPRLVPPLYASVSSIDTHTNPNQRKEMDHLLQQLEQGSVLTKLFAKGKPEKRSFQLKRMTEQLVWSLPVAGRSQVEGCIDVRLIREVRIGKTGKLFDKWQDEAKKFDSRQCFLILFGSTFRLKSVSCCGTRFTLSLHFLESLFPVPDVCDTHVLCPCFLTHTLAASSPKECENWVRGLRHMARTAAACPTPERRMAWLRREFELIKNTRDV